MSLDVKVSINKEEALSYFTEVAPTIEQAVDDAMREWLENVKELALAIKTWDDRSGTLTESHIIRPEGDGYVLEVNPYLNPLKRVTGNYAYFLEYGYNDYTTGQPVSMPWINPAVEMLLGDLDGQIKKAVDDALKFTGRAEQIMRGGREITIFRCPITGQFAPTPR